MKQYTEAELREWLESTNLSFAGHLSWRRHKPTHHLMKPENMKYADERDAAMWFAIYNFARFLGAIKEQEK